MSAANDESSREAATSTDGLERMTFEAHKETTAADCEAVAVLLTDLAAEVRKGDMRAFEAFWIDGGTEEGDAKVQFIREMMALRYYHRDEASRSNEQGERPPR